MSQYVDPFAIVSNCWGSKPVKSDTLKAGINLNSKEGVFEGFILAVLYSIEDTGELAEQTFKALQNQGFAGIDLLSSIQKGSQEWALIEDIFKEYYRGRLKTRKTQYITEGARFVTGDTELKGDLRNLYSVCGGDGYEMLRRLWKFKGIQRKIFWIMREMRMQGVWNVDGKYCCVPDKQVGSSLARWGKISKWSENQNGLGALLECSEEVWKAFGELYDFPVLHYARQYKCNDKRLRKCQTCNIVVCNARPTHVTGVEDETEDRAGEDKDNNEEELELTLPTPEMDLLKKIARDKSVDVSKLARKWIIERLHQVHSGDESYMPSPLSDDERQKTMAGMPASRLTVGLSFKGTINDARNKDKDGWHRRSIGVPYDKSRDYPEVGDSITVIDVDGGKYESEFTKSLHPNTVCLGKPSRLKEWHVKHYPYDKVENDNVYFEYTGCGLEFRLYTSREWNAKGNSNGS